MATATEVLKEKVLGTELEPQLSAQTRNNFLQYARKDEGSDEYYMTETEFVDAIAPEGEDYVSTCRLEAASMAIVRVYE
jgi:solute carrier family 25 aspartate/glutamate transporter 12/13